MAESAAPRRSWVSGLTVYWDRRMLVMLGLGFSSGLPFLLIFDTLSAWLRAAGLSLETITFFSLATLAYAFKFIWAPWIDRTRVPVLDAKLGHRRAWMIVSQLLIMLGLWLVAGSNPIENLPLMAAFAVLTGFIGATQDIVIDAWRIEAADENEQGAMAAAYQWGYRGAIVTAGAMPLVLAELYSWRMSYSVMAILMSIGILAVLFAPREKHHTIRAIPVGPDRPAIDRVEWFARLAVLVLGALVLGSGLSGRPTVLAAVLPAGAAEGFVAVWRGPVSLWIQLLAILAGFALIVLAAWPLPGRPTRPGLYLSHAFGDPLREFFARFSVRTATLILALICFYRISDFVLNLMNPFYIDLGFTLPEIARVRKIYGVGMSMAGIFLGGVAIARWGLMKSLVIGAFIGPLTNLVFVWLTAQGPEVSGLVIAISADNIGQGFCGTCLIAYLSSLTSEGFTATQYAFFSSLYALPGKFIASQSGRVVESAARAAEAGASPATFMPMLETLPDASFAAGAGRLGVSPEALGAGYVTFFIYSFAIGMIVVPLVVMVWRRRSESVQSAIGR